MREISFDDLLMPSFRKSFGRIVSASTMTDSVRSRIHLDGRNADTGHKRARLLKEGAQPRVTG
jgi:hypothetical protein